MLKHQTITFLEKSFSFACFLKGISEAVARRCSVKKVFLEISQKFTGKYLCQSLFSLQLKKRLWHRSFPVNFTKFWRTSFIAEHLGWLLPSFRTSDSGLWSSNKYFPHFRNYNYNCSSWIRKCLWNTFLVMGSVPQEV